MGSVGFAAEEEEQEKAFVRTVRKAKAKRQMRFKDIDAMVLCVCSSWPDPKSDKMSD